MSRRRITNREIRDVAEERIEILLRMSEAEALGGNLERSRRYFGMARNISMRTNIRLPKGFLYCRHCLTPLVPGRNCRVRLRSRRVVTHCLACEGFRRHPYIKERRKGHGNQEQKGN